jgi:NAD(P)H-hydrate epimerase
MLLSCHQVRTLDRVAIEDYGIPALVLMENAGRGVADVLISLGIAGPVAICCGKGNNGGDGLVVARHLVNQGHEVKVLLFAPLHTLSTEAAVHWHITQRMGIRAAILTDARQIDEQLPGELAQAEWILDALFGTGLTGALRPPFDRVVAMINESQKKVLAVDIPSGLDADTGEPHGPTIRATDTVTFVAGKKGFANPAAAAWLGTVHVVDIGVPKSLIQQVAGELS